MPKAPATRVAETSAAAPSVPAFLLQVLTATYWFEAERRGSRPYSVSVGFSGTRAGGRGRGAPGDHFENVESVPVVIPGSGWVALTTTVRGVNPGEWVVTAQPLRGGAGSRRIASSARRRWAAWGTPAMSSPLPTRVRTVYAPFVRVPGTFPLAWITFVGTGTVIGLVIQGVLAARSNLDIRAGLAISAIALVAGFLGAKAWYLVQQRQFSLQAFVEGMCIQGFIAGAAAALLVGLSLTRVPVGSFLDIAAPGLLIGMAIGRPGCFFAGCCTGRCTASRWGIWSSDRQVGARRIPTQLLESALCVLVGGVALALVSFTSPARPGAIAVAAVAAYTVGRQVLLGLRSEARKSSVGRPLVAIAALLVLGGDVWLGLL